MRRAVPLTISLALLGPSCGGPQQQVPECPPTATERLAMNKTQPPRAARATVAEAAAFVRAVEPELLELWIARERASWVKSTFITHDTELQAAKADELVMEYVARKAAEATRFDGLALPPDLGRKLKLLKLALSLPAPRDAKKRAELARIANGMESTYGKGKFCSRRHQGKCLTLDDIAEIMAKSRDYDELHELWQGWHSIAPPMRSDFARYVELANEGARELGFANLGDLWKSRYDMAPAAFEAEVDRLWDQVKPLYQDLHCFVRGRLQAKYGKRRVPATGPLPAHLLGNMWAQEWSNLFELLKPTRDRALSFEQALKDKGVDEVGMVKYGEGFFASLGLTKLPDSFWKRSMFKRPADREVVCHASAWDIDFDADLRIKMCIKINEEDFTTIHHELGHNYYQYYCRKLAPLFRDSANDGFHEALGDTIALSVTPSYLTKVGLLEAEPPANLNPLMNRALEKVAFLPFGLVIDKWRWDVFAGKVKPADYNRAWWELRTRYQGVAPVKPRGEEHFDPGAKYHVPANVPYTRYFLAAILQFQFHRALCKAVGHKGPLHTCSIYRNREAGRRLRAMMEMGLSRPWPEALKALTGEEKMDASAILAYFEPLHSWLRKQNKGKKCGW
jgi:peptidyl-dipeptidase A